MERSGENVHDRRRILSDREMLFLFPETISDADEEGVGVSCTAFDYGTTACTVSNYFRQVLFALSRIFERTHPNIIS